MVQHRRANTSGQSSPGFFHLEEKRNHLDESRPKSTSPKIFIAKIWRQFLLFWLVRVRSMLVTHLVVCRINKWHVFSSSSLFLFCIFPNLLSLHPTSVGPSPPLLHPFSLSLFLLFLLLPSHDVLPLSLRRPCFLYSLHFNATQSINLSIKQSKLSWWSVFEWYRQHTVILSRKVQLQLILVTYTGQSAAMVSSR